MMGFFWRIGKFYSCVCTSEYECSNFLWIIFISFDLFSVTRNIKNGGVDYKNFLLRRILRIWPLYFIAIVVALFVSGFEWYKSEF
jgi:hypothetical protein